MCVIVIPEGETQEKRKKKEIVVAKNILKLMTDIRPHSVQEIQRTLSRIKSPNPTGKHITFKLQTTE
jgi:hypothetical protein